MRGARHPAGAGRREACRRHVTATLPLPASARLSSAATAGGSRSCSAAWRSVRQWLLGADSQQAQRYDMPPHVPLLPQAAADAQARGPRAKKSDWIPTPYPKPYAQRGPRGSLFRLPRLQGSTDGRAAGEKPGSSFARAGGSVSESRRARNDGCARWCQQAQRPTDEDHRQAVVVPGGGARWCQVVLAGRGGPPVKAICRPWWWYIMLVTPS